MKEIFDIIFLFALFSIFILGPLNLLLPDKLNLRLNNQSNLYFNLILNLNVLLILSVLELKLSNYIYLIYFLLFIFLIRNYAFKPIRFDKNISPINISIFFSIFFIIAIDISAKLDLSWDAKWFWYIKSLYFYQDNTFKELSLYIFNDFHPHFGSYIWAFFRKISLNEFEYYGRLFYLYFYLLALFLVTKNLFKNQFNNIITFLILVIVNYKYYYLNGLQEVLIFSLLVFISKFIHDYLKSKNIVYLFFICLSSNLIIWIKAEGIAFFLISIICVNLIKKIEFSHRVKFNIFMFSLLISKILLFKFFNINLNNQPYYFDYFLSLNFDILIYKLQNISIYLIYNSLNNVILILVPIILLIEIKKFWKDEFLKMNTLFYILNILFIFSAYILRDMEVVYALKTTIDRLVFASSGFYLFYVIIYMKKLFSKFN